MTKKTTRELEKLFDGEIVPLGKRARGSGVALLETRWKGGAASYFVRRPLRSMTKADFEHGGCASPDTLAADFARLWRKPENQPLARLAPSFARLAATLRNVEEEAQDVSDFIYVMY
jgi:hypothetical protein